MIPLDPQLASQAAPLLFKELAKKPWSAQSRASGLCFWKSPSSVKAGAGGC